LNKIGFKDFLAYINGGKYDVRQVALFLTIASYITPSIFDYINIPLYSGDPLRVYTQYLLYLSEFGQTISSEIEQLSEVSSYHSSDIEYILSELENQSIELAVLFTETYLLNSEVSELSECCNTLTIDLGETTSELLSTIDYTSFILTKAIIGLIKRQLILIGILTQLTNTLAQNVVNNINASEYDTLYSELITSYWNLASETVSELSMELGSSSSELLSTLSSITSTLYSTSETTLGLIGLLNQLLNALLGLVQTLLVGQPGTSEGGLLGALFNFLNQLL
jgi:hypothetical protein